MQTADSCKKVEDIKGKDGKDPPHQGKNNLDG